MIPGSNLFNRASRLIASTQIQYFAFQSRTLNAARQWVSTFAPPVLIPASVQAVARSTYYQLGLDLQKNYVNVFAPINSVDLSRDSSGDQFVFDGTVYQLETQTTWFLRDGWCETMAVEIAKSSVPLTTIAVKSATS